MLASPYCVMETKRKYLKIGQVWRVDIYSSGMSDNEFRGSIWYVIKLKNSANMWNIRAIKREPKDLRTNWRWSDSQWIKGSDLLESGTLIEDTEEFKTAMVLFG